MKGKAQMLQVRTHASLIATLDALAERLGQDPRLAHSGRFTRSDAARVAITAGLKALEAEYGSLDINKKMTEENK